MGARRVLRPVSQLLWSAISLALTATLIYQWYVGPVGARGLFIGVAAIAFVTGLIWRSWWALLVTLSVAFGGGQIGSTLWRRGCPACGENDADLIGIVGTILIDAGVVLLGATLGILASRLLSRTQRRTTGEPATS